MSKVKNWIFERKYDILIISIFTLVMTFAASFDSDSYWHLKVGEWVAKNGIPNQDMFSYWDSNFLAHEWLFDVLIYRIYNSLGYNFLVLLRALILASVLWISLSIAKQKGMENKIVVLFSVIFVSYAAKMFIIRPQILSVLLICFELYILEKKQKYWLLPIISLIFVNVHGGLLFVFILIYLVYLFSDIWDKKINKKELINRLAILAIIICTAFITPYGIDCVLYGAKIPGYVRTFLTEFFPLIKSEKDVFLLLFMFLPIAAMAYTKDVEIRDILMFSMGFLMSITWIRMIIFFIPIYIIYGCPYIYKAILDVLKKFEVSITFGSNYILRICYLMYSLFVCVLSIFLMCNTATFIFSTSLEKDFNIESVSECIPIKIVEYIKENIDKNNEIVFNNYNFGGYFVFNDLPIFIDGRTDVYLEEFGNPPIYNDYMEIINAKHEVKELIKKYNIGYFAIYKTDPLFDYLLNNNLGEIVVEDGNYILIKNSQNF